jgi:hypothetical protein
MTANSVDYGADSCAGRRNRSRAADLARHRYGRVCARRAALRRPAYAARGDDGWFRAAVRADFAVVAECALAAEKVWQMVGGPRLILVVHTDHDRTYPDGYGLGWG